MNLKQFRQKYPQYEDMDDGMLSDSIHKKFYGDMPRGEFDSKISTAPNPMTFTPLFSTATQEAPPQHPQAPLRDVHRADIPYPKEAPLRAFLRGTMEKEQPYTELQPSYFGVADPSLFSREEMIQMGHAKERVGAIRQQEAASALDLLLTPIGPLSGPLRKKSLREVLTFRKKKPAVITKGVEEGLKAKMKAGGSIDLTPEEVDFISKSQAAPVKPKPKKEIVDLGEMPPPHKFDDEGAFKLEPTKVKVIKAADPVVTQKEMFKGSEVMQVGKKPIIAEADVGSLEEMFSIGVVPKKIGKKITEFFRPEAGMKGGEEFLKVRQKAQGFLHRSEEFIEKTIGKMKSWTPEVKMDSFAYLDGQITNVELAAKYGDEVAKTSKQVRKQLDGVGRMLVKRKLMTRATFDKHKGKYIKYLYTKHIVPEGAEMAAIRPSKGISYKHQKQRKDLSPERQEQYGFLEDPEISGRVALGQELKDIGMHDYMTELSKNPDWVHPRSFVKVPNIGGKGVSKWTQGKLKNEVELYEAMARSQPKNKAVKTRLDVLRKTQDDLISVTGKDIPKDFRLLSGRKYGPLDGAYVHKTIERDLNPFYSMQSGAGSKLVDKVSQVNRIGMSVFKVSKVALNPPTMARNVVSGMNQLVMGGMPPQKLPKYYISALEEMRKGGVQYTQAVRQGMFKSNFSVGEIDEIMTTLKRLPEDSTMAMLLEKFMDLGKYYGKIDDVQKLAMYKYQKNLGLDNAEAARVAIKWGMDYSFVHPLVRQLRQHAVPFACVDDRTQILTRRGWLNYCDVKTGDMALSFNMKIEQLEWQIILDIYKKDYDGTMLEIKNRGLDMVLTPNHRVVTYRRRRRNGRKHLEIVTADRLNSADNIPVAAEYLGFPDKQKYSDAFVKIIGWFVTEGHFHGKCDQIIISQNEGKNLNNIIKVFEIEFPGGFNDYCNKGSVDRPNQHQIYVHAKHGRKIRSICPDKQLTFDFILSLPKSQLEMLVETMIDGDGHRYPNGRWQFIQKNNQTLESFQLALCLLGISHGNSHHGSIRAITQRKSKAYSLRRCKPKSVDYKGIIWCPVIPNNGTWMARRNGHVFITHNTYQYKIAPLIAESLKKRPWVVAAGLSIPYVMTEATKQYQNISDKEFDEIRSNLRAFMKRSKSYAMLPWKDNKGNWGWVDVQYFMPWGNLMEAGLSASQGQFKETASATGILSNPWYQLVTGSFGAAKDRPPKDPFTNRDIYNPLDSPGEKLSKYVAWVYGIWAPSFLVRHGAVHRTAKAIKGKKEYFGREPSVLEGLLRFGGVNVFHPTPEQAKIEKKKMRNESVSDLFRILGDPAASDEKKADARKRFRARQDEILGREPKGDKTKFEELQELLGAR